MQNNPMQMLMQLMQTGNNPNMILQDMLVRNPMGQVLLNQINQSGMSPRQFTEQFFRQNNMDIQQIQSMCNQLGIKL